DPRLMIVGDFEALARLDAEYARQMAGLFAVQLSSAAADCVDKESASHENRGQTKRFPIIALFAPPPVHMAPESSRNRKTFRLSPVYPVLMIALLRGVLVEKHPNQAIVETGGVGYDVTIPVSTFTKLPDAGGEVRLRIYTHMREDVLAL